MEARMAGAKLSIFSGKNSFIWFLVLTNYDEHSEPDDYILLEKYTFPSTQGMWVPMGCKGVPRTHLYFPIVHI